MMARSEAPIKADEISLSFPARDLHIYNSFDNAPNIRSRWSRERHCPICGKTFEPVDIGLYVYKLAIPRKLEDVWRREGRGNEFAWFCGYNCFRDAQRMIDAIRAKGAGKEKAAKVQPPKMCRVCGREFVSTAINARYCSPECVNAVRNAKRQERRRKARKNG